MATHVERSIEVEVPVRTAYDQWTQFEEFPRFMTGVQEVRQIGDALTHWVAEIGGVRREWDAAILEQVPDHKVAWAATTGATNAGAVYFQAVGENRTMVRLTLDYEPEGLVERIADFFDVIDRQAVADLDRFKEFIESTGSATGGWRGRVDEGDVIDRGAAGPVGGGVAGVGAATPGLAVAEEAGGTSRSTATNAGTAGAPTTYDDADAAPGAARGVDGPGADDVQGDVLAVGPTGGAASSLSTDTGAAGGGPILYDDPASAPGVAPGVEDPDTGDAQGDLLAVGPTGGTTSTLTTEPGPAHAPAPTGAVPGDGLGGDPVAIDPQHPAAAGGTGTGGPTADAARASSGVAGFDTDPVGESWAGDAADPAGEPGRSPSGAAGRDTGWDDAAGTDPVGESWSADDGGTTAGTGGTPARPGVTDPASAAVGERGPAAEPEGPRRPATGMGGAHRSTNPPQQDG